MILPHPGPRKTLADLEWARLLGALADRCAGPMGKDQALGLTFASTREEVRTRLAEAREATRLFEEGTPLPVREVPDVRESIGRLRVGGALGAGELQQAATALASARSASPVSPREARDDAGARARACATDPTLDDALEEIARVFDADGTLSDSASLRLSELRGEHRAARGRMLSRLDDPSCRATKESCRTTS